MKFSLFAVVAAPALVAAQYGAPDSSAASSSPSSAATSAAATPSAAAGQHFVQVAPSGTLTFSPNSITAAANDNITFIFPTSGGFSHSVTQSSFANPCSLLSGGFDSGLQPNGMQFTITITNASQRKSIHLFQMPFSSYSFPLAIWFFCKQTSVSKHCGAGMVGGINIPNGTANSVDAFVSAAKQIGNNEQVVTASGGLTGVGAVATAPAGSATASGTSSAPASTSSKPSSAERLVLGSGSLLATLFAAFALA